MHQKALDTIKTALLPGANGEDLKKLREDTQKHVQAPLEMAKNASAQVGSGA